MAFIYISQNSLTHLIASKMLLVFAILSLLDIV